MFRALIATSLVTACGGGSSHHLADASATGCMTADCTAVAASLNGLLWQLPCGAIIDTYDCAATLDMTTATLAGTAGTTYANPNHIHAVVERKTYDGGTVQDTYWNIGGTPSTADGYNVYELAISDPAQTYYLNAGTSGIGITVPIDYTETIQASAGATVTLTADPLDGAEIKNIDINMVPVSIAGTSVAQPYDGQFAELDVASVNPQ